jgi:hypothetical protein
MVLSEVVPRSIKPVGQKNLEEKSGEESAQR